MSKGPDTATTSNNATAVTQLPQWVQDAQKYLNSTGAGMAANFLNNPAYAVAGLNTDQQAGFDGARDMFIDTQNNHGPNGQAGVTNANAAQLDPNSIAGFMNPYIDGALNPTLNNMRQQYDQSRANFDAKMAGGGAYGGSRQAIGDAQMAKDFGNQVAQTAGNMRMQGFNNAAQLAGQNVQNQQQTALTNASAANSTANSNAARAMQGNNDWYSHMNQALQGLLASGNQQQQFQQSALDVPWTTLQRMLSVTPSMNNTGGTTTTNGTSTQPLQDNTMSNILGGGMMLAKLISMSDENTKTNVEKIGKDPKTGLDIVAYDDKHDLAQAKKNGTPMPPKRVSVMAQDVAKKVPQAAGEVAGRKVVDMPMLAMIMGAK